MCGRFVLLTNLSVISENFNIQEITYDYMPSSDVLPSNSVAAVIRDRTNRLVQFRWGLIPSWAKDPSMGSRLINARAETLAEKPSFKDAFKRRRCLIIADGFYESLKEGKKKYSFYFRLKTGKPFGFAGLYETWVSPDGQAVNTCTIVTTEPNDLIQPIHNRMPVILPKEKEALWIDPAAFNQRELLSILKPYPSAEMEVVSPTLPGDFFKS
ncbi:MAG TPA: SOS response-associated peptidase [Syntrophales bacterium]|nr:SOS response-associated peptidase [Syntrophales bacterium]